MDQQSEELTGKDGLLSEAMAAFEVDYEYWQPEYYRAEDDIDFSLGNQWPDNIRNSRTQDGRPCLTENRIDVSCIQTINDIRQTRPAINVLPEDDKADIETAKVLKGWIRNTEQRSNANNAYDTGVENSVRGGYGFIRVNTQYKNERTFEQEAVIEAVENPFSVMIDSSSRKLDGSDMRRAFVFVDMPKEKFEEQYPDAQPLSFQPDLEQRQWMADRGNIVRIAEYFYKDEKKTKLYNTPVGALTEQECKELGIQTKGLPSRDTTECMVKWCKFNCQEILEETEWVGKYIPIVPVYGKVVWSDGRRKSFSLTYQGRDPQLRYNFLITAETEWSALQPKAPWVAYEDQMTPQQAQKFAESNIKNHAVLFHKATYDKGGNLLPPPQRQAPPTGSPSLMQQAMVAADGIKATLGIFDASLGARGNETSGKAILARQQEGDNATFHFVDNLATSIRQVGRILIDLFPRIVTGKTIARILGDDNEPVMVPLNQPVKKVGKQWIADPSSDYVIAPDVGSYDVQVTVGPSYATKRQEMTQVMTELFRAMPEMMKYAGDIYFRNSDFDGAQELAERAKKLLPPEVRDDSPEQQALMLAQQQIQAMGQQLMQMDAALKQKVDNQEFENSIEEKKTNAEIEKWRDEIKLKQEELALQWAQLGPQVTPEQVQGVFTALQEMDSNLKDVGHAVSMILDEAESSLIPQEGNTSTVPASL